MDIGKAFKFVFEDQRWVSKVIIGGLLFFIPLVGQLFALGYMLETLRNVAAGEPSPLPEWSDLGTKLVKGLSLAVVLLIYSIPIWIFYCLMFLSGSIGGDNGNAFTGLLASCFGCLMGLYGLVFAVIRPAITIRFAATGEIMSAFRFGEVISLITAKPGNYIIALILAWVAGLIAYFGIIACVVGVLFTMFWAMLVEAHLYGQVYREVEPKPVAV